LGRFGAPKTKQLPICQQGLDKGEVVWHPVAALANASNYSRWDACKLLLLITFFADCRVIPVCSGGRRGLYDKGLLKSEDKMWTHETRPKIASHAGVARLRPKDVDCKTRENNSWFGDLADLPREVVCAC